MIEHLVISTVVLAAAMLAARVLPVTARTKHAILLCGLAKFAIPTVAWIGIETIDVAPMAPRVFDGRTAAAPAAESPIDWWLVAWAAVATLVFARWILLRSRTIAAALQSPAAPSHRELALLDQARRVLGIRDAVDLIRSPMAEAPAVLRVVRPVVLLPVQGCDDLDDEELRALLLHELAHVARRDNFVSMLLAAAAALLWFHPLVWLALRQIDAAREQACDEVATEESASYVDALIKVCRATIAPRTAGAACMAGGNLKGRMEHLMNYEGLKKRAWSHRGAVAVAFIAVIAATAFAGAPQAKNEELYSLQYEVVPDGGMALFAFTIVNEATGEVVSSPRVKAQVEQLATVTSEHNGRTIEVQARMRDDGRARMTLIVSTPTETLQRSEYTWRPVTPDEPEYSGAPITINLKDAELSEIMATFSEITGLNIKLGPGVEGLVTIQARDMPWDQALEIIAKQNGLKMTIDGKTIHLTK